MQVVYKETPAQSDTLRALIRENNSLAQRIGALYSEIERLEREIRPMEIKIMEVQKKISAHTRTVVVVAEIDRQAGEHILSVLQKLGQDVEMIMLDNNRHNGKVRIVEKVVA